MNCTCCLTGCSQNPLRPEQEQLVEESVDYDIITNEKDNNEADATNSASSAIMTDEEVQMWANDLVEIYPNPNTGIFYIKSKEIIENIRIFDTQGHMIYEYNTLNTQIEIDLSKHYSGIYWVQTIAKGSIKTSKVILVR